MRNWGWQVTVLEVAPGRPNVVAVVEGGGGPGPTLMFEGHTELKVRRDPQCPICSRDPGEISDEEMGVFPDYELFCSAAG